MQSRKSSIQKGNLHIIKDDSTAMDLDRYTFSNAMAHSVKLGIWEAMLEEYIDSVEFVTQVSIICCSTYNILSPALLHCCFLGLTKWIANPYN